MKKSESDSKSELNQRITELERLVKSLIGEIEAIQRGNNTGFRHENDGGYFD